MKAYHGQSAIKDKYLARVRMHRAADEIINGTYWENGKGCAVGCTLHSSRHRDYETELGIPEVLARLEDRLFESLYRFDAPRAKEWPERFLMAPAVGADLSLVFPKLMLWILLDKDTGVIRRAKSTEIFQAVQRVGDLYERWAGGNKPSHDEWMAARSAARALYSSRFWAAVVEAVEAAEAAEAAAAVAEAAEAAAAVAVAEAAVAAAAAAEAAVAEAAVVEAVVAVVVAVAAAEAAEAAEAADRRSVYSAAYNKAHNARMLAMSDKLIELMAAAPVLEKEAA